MKKKRLPYMPFWVDDYRRDTHHLSTEEHGAYLLLLMVAWESPASSLPDDDEMLARMAGVPRERWDGMKRIVMAFWSLDGRSKKWVQKRLKKERRLAVDRKQKASDAAGSRWKDKKKGNAKTMLAQCHPSITINEKAKAFSADARKKSAEDEIRKAFLDA